MRNFIKHIILFKITFLALFLLLEISSSWLVRKNANFKLPSNPKIIVLGHSHPECAFNDSLISDFRNLSQSGESYFYTYLKVKEILNQNSSVKVVLIEFTNNQIIESMNDWIWSDKFMSNNYPQYSSFMTLQDQSLLISKNTKNFLNSFSISFKNRLDLILKRNYDFTNDIGGYLYLTKNKTDSILNANNAENNKNDLIKYKTSISEINITYLLKIIELCEKYDKKIVLIRSPLHEKYSGFINENKYQEILKNRFANSEFMDFSTFQLSNSEFSDLEHLNYKGAKIFSEWFEKLLNNGLLKKMNKQAYIDAEIERRTHNIGLKIN